MKLKGPLFFVALALGADEKIIGGAKKTDRERSTNGSVSIFLRNKIKKPLAIKWNGLLKSSKTSLNLIQCIFQIGCIVSPFKEPQLPSGICTALQ